MKYSAAYSENRTLKRVRACITKSRCSNMKPLSLCSGRGVVSELQSVSAIVQENMASCYAIQRDFAWTYLNRCETFRGKDTRGASEYKPCNIAFWRSVCLQNWKPLVTEKGLRQTAKLLLYHRGGLHARRELREHNTGLVKFGISSIEY